MSVQPLCDPSSRKTRLTPGDISTVLVEEVGHEDLHAVFFVGVGEDVGTLDDLGEEAEDVVDDEDGGVGV